MSVRNRGKSPEMPGVKKLQTNGIVPQSMFSRCPKVFVVVADLPTLRNLFAPMTRDNRGCILEEVGCHLFEASAVTSYFCSALQMYVERQRKPMAKSGDTLYDGRAIRLDQV